MVGICLQRERAHGKLSILARKWKRKYFYLFQSILARIEESSRKYFSSFQYFIAREFCGNIFIFLSVFYAELQEICKLSENISNNIKYCAHVLAE